MEQVKRKFENPRSPEHRDAYSALALHCRNLVETHTPQPEEGDMSRDLGLESDTALIEIEIPCKQFEDVITNISRDATADDGKHAPITHYTQTLDEIWRKREYQSHEEVRAEWSTRGTSLDQVPGTFEELYGQAIDPSEAFELVAELLNSRVQE